MTDLLDLISEAIKAGDMKLARTLTEKLAPAAAAPVVADAPGMAVQRHLEERDQRLRAVPPPKTEGHRVEISVSTPTIPDAIVRGLLVTQSCAMHDDDGHLLRNEDGTIVMSPPKGIRLEQVDLSDPTAKAREHLLAIVAGHVGDAERKGDEKAKAEILRKIESPNGLGESTRGVRHLVWECHREAIRAVIAKDVTKLPGNVRLAREAAE